MKTTGNQIDKKGQHRIERKRHAWGLYVHALTKTNRMKQIIRAGSYKK